LEGIFLRNVFPVVKTYLDDYLEQMAEGFNQKRSCCAMLEFLEIAETVNAEGNRFVLPEHPF